MKIILIKLLDLWMLAFILRAILTWIPYNPSWKGMYDFLDKVASPIMEPIDRLVGDRMVYRSIDFRPVLAYLVLYFIRSILIGA